MTREQIEKAAKEYASGINMIYGSKDNIMEDFLAGAEWRINSVWHDVSEKPENGRCILVDKEYRIQAVWKQDIGDDWLNDVNHFEITRWAYVEDLLPERKEESE